jgi:hypothetical protein
VSREGSIMGFGDDGGAKGAIRDVKERCTSVVDVVQEIMAS